MTTTISLLKTFNLHRLAALAAFLTLAASVPARAQQSPASTAPTGHSAYGEVFDTPRQAAHALIAAAKDFNKARLEEIFGPQTDDVVLTGELPQDRQRAAAFAAEAHEKTSISVDPKSKARAFILVGHEEWPFPIPLVKSADKWYFDTAAGRQEILYRRIGANELSAIDLCEGYVEAQDDFASRKRTGYQVPQYAQHIIAPAGTNDGLAWKDSQGHWDGPIGEKIAQAIQQGYTLKGEPYHGYYFKILKGQGPAARLGRMDYVVDGVMIGGFALAAAPAEYRETGVKTFIVSNNGIVYEKDLGPATLDAFKKMTLFNPDSSWTAVPPL